MPRLRCAFILSVLASQVFNANAQTETNLHSFAGAPDAANPYAALVLGNDGNFYSTTTYGGTNSCNCGTVFRISPNGSETNLYSFAGAPVDGSEPWAALVLGNDGNFYGATTTGGAHSHGCIYRISPSGSETNLYSFAGAPNDGAAPYALMVVGSDGYFYGTTVFGGTSNSGTVYRISSGGSETNLYSFGSHHNDGSEPYGGLALGADGNFYGATSVGGTHNRGCVYRISPSGSETNLYSFVGAPNDGASPYDTLVQGSDGNFYGTTAYGGTNTLCGGGCGTVFRFSPNGGETNLHSLGSYPGGPYAGLIQGSDDNIYGVSVDSVFTMTPAGAFTTLFGLTTSNGGNAYPNGLVQGPDGNYYGTTYNGGTSTNCSGDGCGIVFRFTVPLNPPPYPVNQITSALIAATNIVLAIPSIEGETYQLQFTADLTTGTWSNVPGVSATNSIGALMILTNFGGAAGPQGFYRFQITP